MIKAGVLTEDDPVELLEGILVFKMPKSPRHCAVLARLQRALSATLPPALALRQQDPITLLDGEPEPDLSVVKRAEDDYADRHPNPSEVLMALEVSGATLDRDRGIKLRSYARAGIPEYWIVNLDARTVEVHTDADAAAQPPMYRRVSTFDLNADIPLTFTDLRPGTLPVRTIFP